MTPENAQEIFDITVALQNIHRAQATLLDRLELLSTVGDPGTGAPPAPPVRQAFSTARVPVVPREPIIPPATASQRSTTTNRRFEIRDRVRINNPRFLQQTEGTITKITAKRITVQASNGSLISRAPKNLVLI